MSLLSPHIKHEEEEPFGSTMHDYSNQSNYSQSAWPNMGNGYASMSNPRASISGFGSQSNLSSSFQGGGSTLNDDELGAFLDYDPNNHSQQNHMQNTGGQMHSYRNGAPINHFGVSAPAQMSREHLNSFSFDGHQNGQYGNHFSNTFAHQRQYTPGQVSKGHQQQAPGPSMRNTGLSYRPAATQAASSRMPFAPVSPQNPTITALQQLGTSDTSSHGGHSLPNHRHRSSSSSQWSQPFELTGSPTIDSPLTSPMSVPPLNQQFGSLTDQAKGSATRSKATTQKAQSVPSPVASKDEQKRAKRRHAHNVVEQKRRDKINERIQELSRLVPPHRLEDSKIRKQMALTARTASANNASMSPPAPGVRRTSSMSQQASTLEDRDMTKGNSLDSAVTWCRDLMWLLQRKLEQESMLIEALAEVGGVIPFEIPEAESRMASELFTVMEQNSESNFQYSRSDGSGLYVPNYTDHVGRRLSQNFQSNFQHTEYQDTFQPAAGTPAYSNSDSQGWIMSPHLSGHNDALDYIEEDNKFDMEMH